MKKDVNILIAVLLFFIFLPILANCQELNEIMLKENFDDNSYKWDESDNENVKLKIQSGKYLFQHKKNGARLTHNNFQINEGDDVKIESTILKLNGSDIYGYGIVWGLSNTNNFYSFLISGNGNYMYGKKFLGKWFYLIRWTKTKQIKTNSLNKLTIIKSGNQIQFCINDSLVNTAEFEGYFGNNIGFIVNNDLEIEIDNIIITRFSKKELSDDEINELREKRLNTINIPQGNKFGVGYGAAMFGFWELDLNLKGNITDKVSVECLLGLGLDGPSKKDGYNYQGFGTKVEYEFKRSSKLNFYGYSSIWYLKGSKEALELFRFEGKDFFGLTFGIGSEVWNGYFIDLGFLIMDHISSLTIRCGKHYYF